MVKVLLDVGALVGATRKGLTAGIKKSIIVLEEELKANTPEDTKDMLNSYVSDVFDQGDTVVGEVGNTQDYAVNVEYGVGRDYNYHKPKGTVFYRGQGNRTFARSIDNKKTQILSIIKDELGKQ